MCLTTYDVVAKEHTAVCANRWVYLVLDQAHYIENFQCNKWKGLSHLHSERRLLLSGAPMHSSLEKLWSMLHFLNIDSLNFELMEDTMDYYTRFIQDTGDGKVMAEMVQRLQKFLSPFILRRTRKSVDKQVPLITEKIMPCPLSLRQHTMYDMVLSSSTTAAALASGKAADIFGVLMSLRKICNHPDLFEERAIQSPFNQPAITYTLPTLACQPGHDLLHMESTLSFGQLTVAADNLPTTYCAQFVRNSKAPIADVMASWHAKDLSWVPHSKFLAYGNLTLDAKQKELKFRGASIEGHNKWACFLYSCSLYHWNTYACCKQVALPEADIAVPILWSWWNHQSLQTPDRNFSSSWVTLPSQRAIGPKHTLGRFAVYMPAVRTTGPVLSLRNLPWHSTLSRHQSNMCQWNKLENVNMNQFVAPYWPMWTSRHICLPEPWLLQSDCGKLQVLHTLLRNLKPKGHKVIIFSQMTVALDLLERFLSMHHHSYLRLDSSSSSQQGQALVQRFNINPDIFCLLVSTRTAGIATTLTGADTVVFYDSDWNPDMCQHAESCCQRIGLVRDTTVYRLISDSTVEKCILGKPSNFFKFVDPRDLFGARGQPKEASMYKDPTISDKELLIALSQHEDEADRAAFCKAQAELLHEVHEFHEHELLLETPSQATASMSTELAQDMAQAIESNRPEHQSQLSGLQGHVVRMLESACPTEYFNVKIPFRQDHLLVHDPVSPGGSGIASPSSGYVKSHSSPAVDQHIADPPDLVDAADVMTSTGHVENNYFPYFFYATGHQPLGVKLDADGAPCPVKDPHPTAPEGWTPSFANQYKSIGFMLEKEELADLHNQLHEHCQRVRDLDDTPVQPAGNNKKRPPKPAIKDGRPNTKPRLDFSWTQADDDTLLGLTGLCAVPFQSATAFRATEARLTQYLSMAVQTGGALGEVPDCKDLPNALSREKDELRRWCNGEFVADMHLGFMYPTATPRTSSHCAERLKILPSSEITKTLLPWNPNVWPRYEGKINPNVPVPFNCKDPSDPITAYLQKTLKQMRVRQVSSILNVWSPTIHSAAARSGIKSPVGIDCFSSPKKDKRSVELKKRRLGALKDERAAANTPPDPVSVIPSEVDLWYSHSSVLNSSNCSNSYVESSKAEHPLNIISETLKREGEIKKRAAEQSASRGARAAPYSSSASSTSSRNQLQSGHPAGTGHPSSSRSVGAYPGSSHRSGNPAPPHPSQSTRPPVSSSQVR